MVHPKSQRATPVKPSEAPDLVRTRSTASQNTNHAFSRIDLLAVLSILVLLAVLVMPALARSRVNDQAFQCLNNLRQLTLGWRMYAEDNQGALPSAWDWVRGYLDYSPNNRDNTNVSYLLTGQLGSYVQNPALYKCPADTSTTTFSPGITLPRVRTVCMNFMLHNPNEDGFPLPRPYWTSYWRFSQIIKPTPANLFVLIEENPNYINDAAFVVPLSVRGEVTENWNDYPNVLHNGSCALSFADGHSQTKLWQDAVTLTGKAPSSPFVPFPLPRDDIQWLQDRTTAPLY